jgi:hypothetical protein
MIIRAVKRSLAEPEIVTHKGKAVSDHRKTVERKRTPEGVPGPAVCSEPT